MMRRLTFWACGVFALVGLAVAFLGTSPVFDLYNRQVARVFFGAFDLTPEVRRFLAFLYGPLGATIFGKWILAAWLARGPLARGERWAHDALVAGLVSWFVVDS